MYVFVITHTPFRTLNFGNWGFNPGLKKLLPLPFSVRPQIREELSLAKATQAGHCTVTLHRFTVQVLRQWQQLVAGLRSRGLDHPSVV